jgi:pimeloyl-ACP methyl ester carboxylesterase
MERGLVRTEYGYIHYRHAGREHPRAVVVSHINQQSSALMIELIEALARKVHAIAIDYPSCGMSDHVTEQPTLGDYAKCVIAAMDALDVRRATALGEATGAHVSAELAAAYPDRMEGAVLVNCPYYADRSASERAHTPLRGNLRPEDPSGFPLTRTLEFVVGSDAPHSPVNANQAWMDRINRAQIEAGRDRWQPLRALGLYDLAPAMARIEAPVLILMGEHFHYTSHLADLTAMARNCKGEVIPGARFCATWSHAEHVAERTFGLMGV